MISNGVVFIGNRTGDLNAINATTGELKWKINTNGISLEMTRFAVNNGTLYFAGWYAFGNNDMPGSLYAVKESDGSPVWTSLKKQGFSSGPTYADGKIFINSDDGNIYAVDALTGQEIWKKLIYANGAIPAVMGDKVFAGGGGSRSFHVLGTTTGSQTWSYDLPNSITTSKPLIVVDDLN